MNQRPIILKAHEVRGILDGKQTQLRRIVKRQPEQGRVMKPRRNRAGNIVWMSWKGEPKDAKPPHYIYGAGWDLCKCPFGQVGDLLWGRETWAVNRAKGAVRPIIYRADLHCEPNSYAKHCAEDPVIVEKWSPSTHMPRWASRILLEIVSVRVERLQDISVEDCIAQGCSSQFREHDAVIDLFNQYGDQWQADYGYESWQSNPWVWVVEFERVEA